MDLAPSRSGRLFTCQRTHRRTCASCETPASALRVCIVFPDVRLRPLLLAGVVSPSRVANNIAGDWLVNGVSRKISTRFSRPVKPLHILACRREQVYRPLGSTSCNHSHGSTAGTKLATSNCRRAAKSPSGESSGSKEWRLSTLDDLHLRDATVTAQWRSKSSAGLTSPSA